MVSEAVPSPSTEAKPAVPAPTTETSPRAEASPAPAAPAAQPVGAQGGSPSVPDIDSLLRDPTIRNMLLQHPILATEVDQRAQSKKDREIAKLQKQQEIARAAEERRRELEGKSAKDPYELGKEEQERAQRELLKEELRPVLEVELRKKLEAELRDQFFGEGQAAAYAEVGNQLEAEIPEWRQLSYAERVQFLQQHGNLVKVARLFLEKDGEKKVAALVEKETAKIRAANERESRAEERQNEPGPEIGGGAPPQSDQEFLAAFSAGRLSTREDFARARRITGMT